MKLLFLDVDGVLNSHQFLRERNPKEMDPYSKGELRTGRWVLKMLRKAGVDQPSLSVVLTDLRSIDRSRVALLNGFLEKSGAKVVISSTWRKTYPWRVFAAMLTEVFGLRGEVIGQTPHGLPRVHHGPYSTSQPLRGDEIQEWLRTQKEQPDAFIIFDDDTDMAEVSDRHIRTDMAVGLTEEDVERGLRLLGLDGEREGAASV